METKVNSGVVANRVTMKLGPSVVPVGTETVLVLCCIPLHHFISLGTAGSLVDEWTGLGFDWGGCIYMSTLPSTQTLFPSSSLPLSSEYHTSSLGKVDGHGALSVFVEQQLGAEGGNSCIKLPKLSFEAKALLKNKAVQELFSGYENKWLDIADFQMATFFDAAK